MSAHFSTICIAIATAAKVLSFASTKLQSELRVTDATKPMCTVAHLLAIALFVAKLQNLQLLFI